MKNKKINENDLYTDTDINKDYILGRNGLVYIQKISLLRLTTNQIVIEGIGKSGSPIRGGLTISEEAMDKIAKKWIKYRRMAKK